MAARQCQRRRRAAPPPPPSSPPPKCRHPPPAAAATTARSNSTLTNRENGPVDLRPLSTATSAALTTDDVEKQNDEACQRHDCPECTHCAAVTVPIATIGSPFAQSDDVLYSVTTADRKFPTEPKQSTTYAEITNSCEDTYGYRRPYALAHQYVESDNGIGDVNINDNQSCQSDGLPDTKECGPLFGHLNVVHMTGVVHSFMVDRDNYCVLGQQMANGSCSAARAPSIECDISGATDTCNITEIADRSVPSQHSLSRSTRSSVSSTALSLRAAQSGDGGGMQCGSTGDCHRSVKSSGNNRNGGETSCCQTPISTLSRPATDNCANDYIATRATLARLNSVEPATAVFSTLHSPALGTLTSAQVIDALHNQLGADALRSVRSVRVDSGTVYLSMSSRQALLALLQSGGHHRPLTLGGVPVYMADVAQGSVILLLSGVPHYVSDHSVRLMMASYGVVVGGVERRFHRAVDTGDRLLRLRRTSRRQLPRFVTVCGVRILVYALKHDQLTHVLCPDQYDTHPFNQLCRTSSFEPVLAGNLEPAYPSSLHTTTLLATDTTVQSADLPQRRSHSVESGLNLCRHINEQSVSLQKSPSALSGPTSSNLEINLRLQSEPDVSRPRREITPDRNSPISPSNFGWHKPVANKKIMNPSSLAQTVQPATACRDENDVSAVHSETEENIDAVLASYYSVSSEPTARRHTVNNPSCVSDQCSVRRLRFSQLAHDSQQTSPSHSQDVLDVRSKQKTSFTNDPQSGTCSRMQSLQNRHYSDRSGPGSHLPNGDQNRNSSGHNTNMAPSTSQSQHRTPQPHCSGPDDIEEDDWSSDEEDESDDSQETKDLPWCGCWGNGCF